MISFKPPAKAFQALCYVGLLALTHCPGRTYRSGTPGQEGAADRAPGAAPAHKGAGGNGAPGQTADLTVETAVELPLGTAADAVQAGTALTVRCVARRGSTDAADVAVRAEMVPRAPRLSYDSGDSVFVPEQAGTYRIFCRTAAHSGADAAADPQGKQITVVPGPVQSLSVALQQNVLQAGTPVALRCNRVDAYGNPTEAAQATTAQAVFSGEPLQAAEVTLADGQLSITKVGHFQVACRQAGLADTAAVEIEVQPAAAARLFVATEPGEKVAGTFFAAGCRGADAYGNAVPGPFDLSVLPLMDNAHEGFESAEQIALYTAGAYELRCSSDASDASDAPPSDPLTVQVAAGLPAYWGRDSGWGATSHCLTQNMPHNLAAFVYDSWDNLIAQPKVDLTVTQRPQGSDAAAAQVGPHGVTFRDIGIYSVVATVHPPYAPGFELPPQVMDSVYVNSTSPQVTVTTPQRAARVVAGTAETEAEADVEVEGEIYDAAGLTSVTLLGETLALADRPQRYAFKKTLKKTPWGMSLIEIAATNSCQVEAKHVQSFLRSPAFYNPLGSGGQSPAALRSPGQAVALQVGAPMLKNLQDQELDNVASVVEAALRTDMVSKRMGEVLAVWPSDAAGAAKRSRHWFGRVNNEAAGYKIVRTADILYTNPQVERLEVQAGRLVMRLSLHDVQVAVKIQQVIDWGVVAAGNVYNDYPAKISADSMTIDVGVGVGADGLAQLKREDVQVSFTGGPKITLGTQKARRFGLAWLPQYLVDSATFANRHSKHLSNNIADHMHAAVEQSMADALHSLDWQHPLALPEPFHGGIVLQRQGEKLDFVGEGEATAEHVSVAVEGHILPAQEDVPVPAALRRHWEGGPAYFTAGPGAIVHRSSPMQVGLPASKAFGVLVHDDLVNEFLWAMWVSGAFNVPQLQQFLRDTPNGSDPINGSEIAFYAAAPPVLMPSDRPNRVILSWGDMFIDAHVRTSQSETGNSANADDDANRVHISLFASASLEAEIELDSHAQKLRVRTAPECQVRPLEFKIQTVQISGHGSMRMQSAYALEQWLSAGLPELLKRAVEDVPLPAVDIGAIAGVPPNTAWMLEDATLSRAANGHFTVLQGGVQSTLKEVTPEPQ
jgi:hypothetical protein